MKQSSRGRHSSGLLSPIPFRFHAHGNKSVRLVLEQLENRDAPATFTVTTLADAGAGSLRDAVDQANAAVGADIIDFQAGLTGTIALTTGQLTITDELSIDGPGAKVIAVSGSGLSRIFHVDAGAKFDLSMKGVTLTNGKAASGGAVQFLGDGNLSVLECALTGNTATADGGALFVNSSKAGVTLSQSTFSGNGGVGSGAIGLLNVGASISNCTISGNTASAGAGGIAFAKDGAGAPTLLALVNTTLAGNTGTTANSVSVTTLNGGAATAKYANSIFASTSANFSFSGAGATGVSLGNNISTDGTGNLNAAGDLPNTNPLLSALNNFGGNTATHALLPGSPGINAGQATALPTDQRGIARVGSTDIGSFESQGFTLTISGGDNQSAIVLQAFADPLEVTVASAFSEPVEGGLVTFTPPAIGASATLTGNPASISAVGKASVTATANNVQGAYLVTATANSSNTVSFGLTNLNGPPTAKLNNNGPINEGSKGKVTFTNQDDPEPADKAATFRYAYDFDNNGTFEVGGNGKYAQGTPSDFADVPANFLADGPGTRVVRGRIIDQDDGFTDYLTTIQIDNVAPIVTVSGNPTVNEGSPYTLAVDGIVEPGQDTIAKITINWGDGNVETFTGAQLGADNKLTVGDTFVHTYADGNGAAGTPRTIQVVSVEDEDGAHAQTDTHNLVVNNVAPVVTISSPDVSIIEGKSVTVTIDDVVDPGTDIITEIQINWGDGNIETFKAAKGDFGADNKLNKGDAFTHVYADDSDVPGDNATKRTISFTVTDEDGTFAQADTHSVIVNNVAPVVAISSKDADLNEADVFTFQVDAVTDPGVDTITKITITWGDGDVESFTGAQLGADNKLSVGDTFSHQYRDDSDAVGDNATKRVVSFTVTDEDGTFAQIDTETVTVNNVAPVVTILADTVIPIDEGQKFTFRVTKLVDPGIIDTITAVKVNWGDGNRDGIDEIVTFTASKGELGPDNKLSVGDTFTHLYDDGPAKHVISFDVTDEDGTFAQASTEVVIVNNVPPTLQSITGPTVGARGQPRDFVFIVTDPSVSDTTSGFTIVIDWGHTDVNGKQDIQTISMAEYKANVNNGKLTVSHAFPGVFNALGNKNPSATYTISAHAIDKDGGKSNTNKAAPITIFPTLVENNIMVIGGTTKSDRAYTAVSNGMINILISSAVGKNGAFERETIPAKVASKSITRFQFWGQDGNDTLAVFSAISAEIHGGPGNDACCGGSGDDLLFGDEGNDRLQGDKGNDLMVGGGGSDILNDQVGANVFVGGGVDSNAKFGSPKYNASQAAQVLGKWVSTRQIDSVFVSDIFDTEVDTLGAGSGVNVLYGNFTAGKLALDIVPVVRGTATDKKSPITGSSG